jgi:organic radical activating enzyme
MLEKYCVMPFTSVRIEDAKNARSTSIRPCCLYDFEQPVKFNSIEEYINSPELKNLQQHLLTQDELPSGCFRCQAVESAKQLSVRQLKKKYFNNISPTTTEIQELDLFVSNVCNLSCVMCQPKHSSAVAAEHVKLGLIDQVYNFDETDFVLHNLKLLPNLKYVSIAGGEFFYAKHHKKILLELTDCKIPNIKITTNGTIYNQDTVNILKQIPKLTLRFSLDGVTDRYEFIRYPAKWLTVEKNLLKFKQELPDAHIELVIVMSPMTVYGIYDWLNFANTHEFETHFTNILGDALAWEILTDEERSETSKFLIQNYKNKKLTQPQIVTLLNYANSTLPRIQHNVDLRKKSINLLLALGQLRSVNKENLLKLTAPWPTLCKEIDEISNNYN